jgi:hypothetical protein
VTVKSTEEDVGHACCRPDGECEALNHLGDALAGMRGADQQRIARVGLEWIGLLLAKNLDYGSSAWKTPVLAPGCDPATAILVRMSDKIERLGRLLGGHRGQCDESIEDTIRDLGAYCLLWLARPREEVTPDGEEKNDDSRGDE